MYYEHYGFQLKPFNQTPDPRFIYLSLNHREAFAHLLYGIKNHVGFIAISGEVGSGKTTVLRSLLNQLDTDHYRTAFIFNPALSPSELLRSIAREFGLILDAHDSIDAETGILEKLNDFLIRENAEKRTVVLVIDEAQNLTAEVLEQIRLISNLETDSDKLIQIILSGQPELLDLLKAKNLRQLNQRITVRYHLKPLDFKDTRAYINHRIEIAKGRVFFSRQAVAQIYRYSGGLPRLINSACERALMAGYTRNATEITRRIAAIAVRDLARHRSLFVLRRPVVLYSLIVLGILSAAIPLFLNNAIFSDSLPVRSSERVADSGKPAMSSGIAGKSDPFKTPSSPSAEAKGEADDLERDFRSALERVSEDESLRFAVNEISRLWKVAPTGEDEVTDFKHLHESWRSRGLNLLRFTGNLDGLKVIDCPAVLELVLPGKAGKRYAALIGFQGEKVSLGTGFFSDALLTRSNLDKYWSGRAYIPWKNFLRLPETLALGRSGGPVRRIQKFLSEMGIYHQPITGKYDMETEIAVKLFQSNHGLEPDGIVRFPTLLALYRSADRFEVPRLTRTEQP